MKDTKYFISRITVPTVEYQYDKTNADVPTQTEITFTIEYKPAFVEDRGIAFPCTVTANIQLSSITAKIIAKATVGISGQKEIPSDEDMKILSPILAAPIKAKIAEVFSYLTGNSLPFPVILQKGTLEQE